MRITQKVKFMVPVAGGIIILVVLSCFMGLTLKQDQMIHNYIHLSAQSFFDSILITRRWSANYGGVYVQKKDGMQSNPYLERPDITTADGIVYTLKNPALMTREISEMAQKSGGYRYHITSLKLMNPENRPDSWERESLEKFEADVKETAQIMEVDGRKVYRLMRPILFETGCTKCHGKQNYKIGDVRGGISVALPYDEISQALASNRTKMISLAIAIIALFSAVFYLIVWKLIDRLSRLTEELDAQKKSLEDLNVGLDRRVTERTAELGESEKRFRNTFEQAAVGICHATPDGRFLRINQRFCEIVGYSADELEALTFKDITHPDDLDNDLQHVQQMLDRRIQSFSIEKRYFRKDKTVVWVNLTVSLVRAACGAPEYFISVIEDITERRRVESQLQQAQKMEAIGTLAGGIAHDFNNILSAIVGYTDLALMKVAEEEPLRNDLLEVRRAADRATALAKQILTFSRKEQLEKSPLKISLVIKEALKLLRASIPSTIDIRQDITAQGTSLADPTQIHQVIMNLCTNAYHAMIERGGVLGVTLKEVSIEQPVIDCGTELPPGHYLKLSVSDTGCGINEETMSRIFEPYFTTKEKGRGTGLGLAVVHGIIKEHQGRIAVYSEPGQGTTFNVYLPMISQEQSTDSQDESLPPRTKAHERIMVVDDDAALRDSISQFLTQAGYRVDLFTNGVEAWAALQQTPDAWHLLLTDQTMPGMTGDQLAAKVRELRPGLPVIISSGFSEILDESRVRDLGVKAYLQKPVGAFSLITAVAKALHGEIIPS